MYADRLDRAFVVFRNGSRDERLDQRSRLSLLELIELRAINWNSTDYMTSFYKLRQLNQIEEMTLDALNSPTPTTPPMMGLPGQSLLQATVQSPPILSPGEVIKASGKFTKPTKIPGKNYSKDEVIIRNSDSGKGKCEAASNHPLQTQTTTGYLLLIRLRRAIQIDVLLSSYKQNPVPIITPNKLCAYHF